MNRFVLLLGLAVAGCAAKVDMAGAPRPKVLRDVEGYAIASCLAHQAQPYLKDQGDAWASVVIQRGKAPVEALAAINDAVKREIARGNMAVIRAETGQQKDKALPLLYCGEIIDTPPVRTAIQKAVAELGPRYER
jgi:endonuclease/exonuclease/phosphatase family metal-dependent hydrolase